ncbi:MAG: anti-sigma-I factor RsgI family protein [Erysipelotrichaceae bacterium]|jgi:hypothetical protein
MKKYIVMECHLSYAVVLDEEGHFLKVANRHYKVGQTVNDVIEMQIPQPDFEKKEKKTHRWYYFLTAAACLIVIFTIVFQTGQTAYASIYMKINPEVRIDVNQNDIVVGLESVNVDGSYLIEGYDYKKKNLDSVMTDLLEMAIEKGYLYEGCRITLTLDAKNNEWIISHTDSLSTQLNEYLSEKLTVTIEIIKKSENNQIIIPINPDDSDYGDSDYDDSDYEDSNNNSADYDDSDYDDSDYESDSGLTDYD